MTNKDPAMTGQYDYERSERDWYPTPPEATQPICEFLFQTISFDVDRPFVIWEPAAGDGAMADVLEEIPWRFKTIKTDIHPLRADIQQADFFKIEPTEDFDAIITNPPYGKDADRFLERMMTFVAKGKWAAVLARHELDCAKSRKKFFGSNPHFHSKIVLLWRPRWIAGSTGSPRHNYAWFVFGPGSYQARTLYANKP